MAALRLFLATCVLFLWGAAGAQEATDAAPEPQLSERLIREPLVKEVMQHLRSPVVLLSVRASNVLNASLTPAEIETLDQRWRAERDMDVQPLIATMMSNPLSNFLTRVQAGSLGLFTEIIVVNDKGLNTGLSNVTSDMYQGDEAKFQRTFPNGPRAVFVDAAEWHEPSRTWRSQLNMTIEDPDTGRAIGAATFEVNLTELDRRINR